MQQQFPSFHLEDKVNLAIGGIDRPPDQFTYARRKHGGHEAIVTS